MTKLNKNILSIDTTEFGKVIFSLAKSHSQIKFGINSEFISGSKKRSRNKFGMTISKSFRVKPQESEKILEYLDKFLKANFKPLSNSPHELGRGIRRIVIYKGQGSFAGLRVAAAIAQALSLSWQVPVKVVKR